MEEILVEMMMHELNTPEFISFEWDMISQNLASLLNQKIIKLKEAERMGLEECLQLIDKTYGTTYNQSLAVSESFEDYEEKFENWIERYGNNKI